jgi:hypothetical protein
VVAALSILSLLAAAVAEPMEAVAVAVDFYRPLLIYLQQLILSLLGMEALLILMGAIQYFIL